VEFVMVVTLPFQTENVKFEQPSSRQKRIIMKNRLAILAIVTVSTCAVTLLAQTTPRAQTPTSGGVTTQTPFIPARPPLQKSQFSATNSPFTPFPPGLTNQLGTNGFGTNGISGLPDDVILLIRDLQINTEQLRPILAAITGGSFQPGGVGFGGGGTNFSGNSTNFNTASGGAISNQSAGGNFGTVGGANFSSQAGQNLSSSSAVPAGGTTPASPSTGVGFSSTVQPRSMTRAQTGFAAAGGTGNQIGTGTGFGASGSVSGGTQLPPAQLALLGNLQLVLQDVQMDAQELLPRLAQLTGGNVFTNGTGGIGDQSGTNSGFGNLTNTFGAPLTNSFGQPLSNNFSAPASNFFGQPINSGSGTPFNNNAGNQPTQPRQTIRPQGGGALSPRR
jgi:hypothetical protein